MKFFLLIKSLWQARAATSLGAKSLGAKSLGAASLGVASRWSSVPQSRALYLIATFVLLIAGYVGCDLPNVGLLENQADGRQAGTTVTSTGRTQTSTVANSGLIVGSFNIQTFGHAKMGKPEVVTTLVDIVHRFDILAIQELRAKDGLVIPEFLKQVNQGGYNYVASVSRRIGYQDRTSNRAYEEQLVYIYDANKVEITSQPYVAEDRYQQMHRPPYVAQFRCRGMLPEQAFSFVLMNVHVDYDDAKAEFGAMESIIAGLFANHPGEDDFILLGDLNDDPTEFQSFKWLSDQVAAIPTHWKTNTRQSKNYDNIVFDAGRTAEFTGQAGVLNLMSEYNLTQEQALDVSDHMPVWVVFSPFEATSTTITQSPKVLR